MIDRNSFRYSEDFIRWKGGRLRLLLIQSSIVQFISYFLKLDVLYNKFSKSWKVQVEKAFVHFLNEKELRDENLKKDLKKDILRCNLYFHAKPSEYFMYDFRHKSMCERRSYLTDKEMLYYLSIKGYRKLHDLELNDKYNFYLLTSDYFKRSIILLDKKFRYIDFEKFVIEKRHVIVKPVYLGTGDGIFIANVTNEVEAKSLYDRIITTLGDCIVEELIHQSAIMAEFNMSSVNTMRVSTFRNKKGVFVHCPTIRTGRAGFVVDNAGCGGITAVVDAVAGTITTDGYDEAGHVYEYHPNSGVKYKGWQVPEWQNLIETAKKIHNDIFPNHPYIGWDFAHTDNGWVLIEGNWGQYIGKQVCMKKGLRKEFIDLLNGRNTIN